MSTEVICSKFCKFWKWGGGVSTPVRLIDIKLTLKTWYWGGCVGECPTVQVANAARTIPFDKPVAFVVSYKLGGAFMVRVHATTCHLIASEMKMLSILPRATCRPQCAVAKKSHQSAWRWWCAHTPARAPRFEFHIIRGFMNSFLRA